jgi:hypothetical protein
VCLTVFPANCFSALKIALLAEEPKKRQRTAIASVGATDYAALFIVGSSDFIDIVLSEDLTTQHDKKYVTSLTVEVPAKYRCYFTPNMKKCRTFVKPFLSNPA